MTLLLSQRVKQLQESATLKINAQVNRMKQEGQVIYNLTAGEPDFPPFEAAKEAVVDAVKKNLSRYTPTAGVQELRELIAAKMNSQQPALGARSWNASHVLVTNGGKQALFNVILALIERGDEVILGAPYWLSYPEMVKVAEGTTVVIPTLAKAGYKFSAKQLEAALTQKTRMLILNSPSNPTGALYTREEFQALGSVLERFPNVWIVSDEIYDQIDFTGGKWVSFLEACPQFRERTVTVNGLSKSGAMTGWRIGWSVSPETLNPTLIALQGHSTSGICSLSQMAAIATLKLPTQNFLPYLKEYLHRRSLALEVLRKSEKIEVVEPSGAFYLFVDVRSVLKEKQNADGFAEKLLQEAQVAVVSGVDFGAPTCVRLSFATDEKTIREAGQRLVDFCNRQ